MSVFFIKPMLTKKKWPLIKTVPFSLQAKVIMYITKIQLNYNKIKMYPNFNQRKNQICTFYSSQSLSLMIHSMIFLGLFNFNFFSHVQKSFAPRFTTVPHPLLPSPSFWSLHLNKRNAPRKYYWNTTNDNRLVEYLFCILH